MEGKTREEKTEMGRKKQLNPRQRMINLLYIVLMAMLAINVSNDVMDGYHAVDSWLRKSEAVTEDDNRLLLSQLEKQAMLTPRKAAPWLDNGRVLKAKSDSLVDFICSLKALVAKETDSKDDYTEKLENGESLSVTENVFLSKKSNMGERLRKRLIGFRNDVSAMAGDPSLRKIIANFIDVRDNPSWEEEMFYNIPASGALTLLSAIVNNVRLVENTLLGHFAEQIDARDVRMNAFKAFAVTKSQAVVRGDKFTADILLASVDTTTIPEFKVKGDYKVSGSGHVERFCPSIGQFSLDGSVIVTDKEGNRHESAFSLPYTVIEPRATISADIMNVLYAAYENPISVSVPGWTNDKVRLSAVGARLVDKGRGHYTVVPDVKCKQVTITASVDMDGKRLVKDTRSFHVRRMPPPTAYLTLGNERFTGGRVDKGILLSADRLEAAIDDGILDIGYKVKEFVMIAFDGIGNAKALKSNGARFTEEQKKLLSSQSKGKRIFLTDISTVGIDGLRRLPRPMEIILK